MTPQELRALKARLRRALKEAILAMPLEERARQEAELRGRFFTLPGLDQARRVLLYVGALPEEIDTRPMMEGVLERAQVLVLPRIEPGNPCLRLHRVRDPSRDLVAGPFRGVPEPGSECEPVRPSEVDWALVPGLGFDRRGHRIGRGAGFYDRLLVELPQRAQSWALAYSTQIVDELPIGPHDQALTGAVTAHE